MRLKLDEFAIQGAFRRPRRVGGELRVAAVQRRAIRANVFGVVAHVAIDMWMIERRQGADTHEFLGADLDDRNAEIVMEVRDDRIRHALDFRLVPSYWGINPGWSAP